MKNSSSVPDVVDLEDGWRPLAELGVEHGAKLVGGRDQNQLHYRGSYSTGPQILSHDTERKSLPESWSI
jgi:hypothetical protein